MTKSVFVIGSSPRLMSLLDHGPHVVLPTPMSADPERAKSLEGLMSLLDIDFRDGSNLLSGGTRGRYVIDLPPVLESKKTKELPPLLQGLLQRI